MEYGEIDLRGAGIDGASFAIGVDIADTVGGAQHAFPGRGVAGVVMPHHEAEHAVVVAPEIPVAQEALVLGPWAEVSVVGLAGDEIGHEGGEMRFELGIVRHAERLNARDEVLSRELARPWHGRIVGQTAVAPPEHLDQSRIRVGRAEKPLRYIALNAGAKFASKTPVGVRDDIHGRYSLCRHFRYAGLRRIERTGQCNDDEA